MYMCSLVAIALVLLMISTIACFDLDQPKLIAIAVLLFFIKFFFELVIGPLCELRLARLGHPC